jgi:hypothetical protein
MDNTAEVKKCYGIAEDDNAMTCIKEVVKKSQVEGGCVPRIVLLYRDGCGGCIEEKARYKKDIDSGLVTPVDIFSDEGKEIAKRNDIDAVPAVLIVDCNGLAIE